MRCRGCGRLMRPQVKPQARQVLHAARGLCTRCYQKHRKTGTLSLFETVDQHWEVYADDYEMLRQEGYRLPEIAARLGITLNALDKALCRNINDPRAKRPFDLTGIGRPRSKRRAA